VTSMKKIENVLFLGWQRECMQAAYKRIQTTEHNHQPYLPVSQSR